MHNTHVHLPSSEVKNSKHLQSSQQNLSSKCCDARKQLHHRLPLEDVQVRADSAQEKSKVFIHESSSNSSSRDSESQLSVPRPDPQSTITQAGEQMFLQTLCSRVTWALIWSAPKKFPLMHLLFQHTLSP